MTVLKAIYSLFFLALIVTLSASLYICDIDGHLYVSCNNIILGSSLVIMLLSTVALINSVVNIGIRNHNFGKANLKRLIDDADISKTSDLIMLLSSAVFSVSFGSLFGALIVFVTLGRAFYR